MVNFRWTKLLTSLEKVNLELFLATFVASLGSKLEDQRMEGS